MKNIILFLLFTFLGYSSGMSQNGNANLSAMEFSDKIKQLSKSPVIDVRTPEEFMKGHLINAKNININGSDFKTQIAKLDKTKPVFVYCLSGARSMSAYNYMTSAGFKVVYNLSGGIMKWRAAGLPETTDNAVASNGMSKKQYDDLLKSDKLVLIDFYADWCAPCKKMKPYLEEISKDMKNEVVVIRINADDNKSLTKELKIDALPVLLLYKNKTKVWSNVGDIGKNEVVKKINSNK